MAYTRHGHHILGTPKDEDHPKEVFNCTGPGYCRQCNEDSIFARIKLINPKKDE